MFLPGQGWLSELRRVHVPAEAAHAVTVGSLHGGGGGHAVHDVGSDLHPRGARQAHIRHRLHRLAAIVSRCDLGNTR